MINTLIVGASGYVGIELAIYLNRHAHANILALFVSDNSSDVGRLLSDIHKKIKGIINLTLLPLSDITRFVRKVDAVFLATDHQVSHDLAPFFLSSGCIVFDLSGAFRINNIDIYSKYYGFTHKYKKWLAKSVYGLAEWNAEKIKNAQLISIPGCYPTCIQLAIKPLLEKNLLSDKQWPIINAISGVSGTGRKPTFNNSFCEVSLQPYGIFNHRHHPEIVSHLKIPVIFIPQLGNFNRGILATITCFLNKKLTLKYIFNVFNIAYKNKPLIRIYEHDLPSIKSVVGLPFCDIGFALQDRHLILVSTEDNLLKGAAAQAIQCFNIRFGFSEILSLI